MKGFAAFIIVGFLFGAWISGAFKSRDVENIPSPPAKISVDKTEQRQ